jgi:transposase
VVDQHGDLQPAYLVAKKLGVSRQLVYWWTRSGKLEQAGQAEDGRPLYSMRSALMVERETRRSPLSHRVA